MFVTFLTLLLKIGVTYDVILSKKVKKYLYNGKNLKRNFIQLRCSNVLLHLEYKLLFCKPKIEFKNLRRAKLLATEHRGGWRESGVSQLGGGGGEYVIAEAPARYRRKIEKKGMADLLHKNSKNSKNIQFDV